MPSYPKRSRRKAPSSTFRRPGSSFAATPARSSTRSCFGRATQSRSFTVKPLQPEIPVETGTRETDPVEVLEDDDDELCQTVMAIDIKERGTVGCSYYIANEKKICILEDVVFGGIDVVETLKLDIEPTIVLVSIRADRDMQEPKAKGQDELSLDTDAQFRLPYHLDIRPSQEFSFEAAKNKLMGLKLGKTADAPKFLVPGNDFSHDHIVGGDDIGFTEEQGAYLHLAGLLGMENRVSIGCAGALLTYLQRQRSTKYLQGDPAGNGSFEIQKLEVLSLKGSMFINRDTLASLQIIQSESHPNTFNQGPGQTSSGSKESLSIFGLFHHFARTPQGKSKLKQHFLRPTANPGIIKARHEFISTFLRHENDEAMTKIIKSLKGVKNLRPVMVHLQKGIRTGNAKFKGFKSVVWATLLEFAFHSIDIHETLKEVAGAEGLDICIKAIHKLDLAKLHHIGRVIYETVDLESSVQEHRTIVRPGVDQELDKLKDTYNGMDSLLSQVAVNIAATLPEELNNELNVIYFPQLGFNIAIPLNEHRMPVYDGGQDGWTQVFTTENRVYFKDSRMLEMDERLGDMYGNICEKEIEIVYDLAQNILNYEALLIEASDVCADIDSLLAFAQGASLYKLVRPRMTDENIISIKGGRHLIHEATVPSYVPNDTILAGGAGSGSDPLPEHSTAPSMILLTGPNYSGKSVYLKQIALIVYMAHIGSFVPAESATIGFTDKILTRITSRETVSKTQSTFAIDLQQVSFAIAYSTNRSLVIIDEFGKGTDSTDGAGLACGLFKYFLSLGEERPKVVAATHFHEIFENGFLTERPELQFGHMEVRMDTSARDPEDQITYLYNFRFGRSNQSFGTVCAAMNGIDSAIVARANEIGRLSCLGEDLVAACAKMTETEMNELEDAEILARKFLQVEFTRPASNTSRQSQPESVASILDSIIGLTATTSTDESFEKMAVTSEIADTTTDE